MTVPMLCPKCQRPIVAPIIQAILVRQLRREQGLSAQDDKDRHTGVTLH